MCCWSHVAERRLHAVGGQGSAPTHATAGGQGVRPRGSIGARRRGVSLIRVAALRFGTLLRDNLRAFRTHAIRYYFADCALDGKIILRDDLCDFEGIRKMKMQKLKLE